MADGETTWLAGTEHAQPLAWSPDSRALAVLANDEIKAVDIATGGVRTLGRAPDDVRVVAEEIDPRIGTALFVIELARSIHAP